MNRTSAILILLAVGAIAYFMYGSALLPEAAQVESGTGPAPPTE